MRSLGIVFSLATIGLAWLIFAEGKASGAPQLQEARGNLASAAAPIAEQAALIEEMVLCPPSRAEVSPEQCSALPNKHGLSPKYPGEWGIAPTEMNPAYIRRLACADGSDAWVHAIGGRHPGAEDDPPILRWKVTCNSKAFTVFASADRCGDPCPPAGLRLIPFEAIDALDSVASGFGEGDANVVRSGVERMLQIAPDFEQLYATGYRRLMKVGLKREALELAEEGLKRFPSSRTLEWMRSAARIEVGASVSPPAKQEAAASIKYSRDPADPEVDRCDGLPPDFGYSEVHALEYGDVPIERLICADGTTPTMERYGSTYLEGRSTSPTTKGRKASGMLDHWRLGCDTQSHLIYLSEYRSGRPCAPVGLQLLPKEAFDAVVRGGRLERENDADAARIEFERAQTIAPNAESSYKRLIDRLDLSTELDRALEIASEGVRRVPGANRLRRLRAVLLFRAKKPEESLMELDEVLRRLERAGDQSIRPLTLCMKSQALERLGRSEEERMVRAEACEWGHEACCEPANGPR